MYQLVRYLFLLGCGFVIFLPVALPFQALFEGSSVWDERERILGLLVKSLEYVGLVWLLAGPLGTILGWVLFRTNLWGKKVFIFLFITGLFVPLSTYCVAWQGILGETKTRWDQGILSAAWIQANASLPWVVCLSGLAWRLVPRSIEEESLGLAGMVPTILRVSFRWFWPSLLVVLFHVGVTAFGEITITDMMLVRTFAEEVYTQFVSSDLEGLNRAIRVSLPSCLIISCLLLGYMRFWNKQVLNRLNDPRSCYLLDWGSKMPLAWTGILIVVSIFFGLPIGKLIHLTGGGGYPRGFSLVGMAKEMSQILRLHWDHFLIGLVNSFGVGLLTTGMAIGLCVFLIGQRYFQMLFLFGCGLIWSLPAPLLGVGLKWTIELGMDWEEAILGTRGPVRLFFYDLPTPLPTIYAQFLKTFPPIFGFLWFIFRSRPIPLIEQGQLLGLTRFQIFRNIDWPRLKGPGLMSLFFAAAYSFSELSTSKLVQVPGRQTFIQITFDQMHYGATSTVAGLALMPILFAILILPTLWYFSSSPKLSN